MSERIRTQIKEVRDLTKQYGPLVKTRSLNFPEILDIINYYEEDGESQAVIDADATVADYKQRLSAAQGATGGLTKRINKLEQQLQEMSNVKSNNATLARIANHAFDLIEHLNKTANQYVDVNGDALTELPLYARLNTEIGEPE